MSCVLSDMCRCLLRLERIGLGIYFIFCLCLAWVCFGVLFGLKLLVNFVVELVKFISDFRSIKFFIAFRKINNIVERGKVQIYWNKLLKLIHIYIYIYTLKKIEKLWGGHCPQVQVWFRHWGQLVEWRQKMNTNSWCSNVLGIVFYIL